MATLAYLGYFVTAMLLLIAFIGTYERFTPYREFDLIKQGNVAAAIALGGAILGFTFPLMSAIYFTHSYLEMIKWAVITGLVQLVVFKLIDIRVGCGDSVGKGNVAAATFVAFASSAVGLLTSMCISY